LKKKKKKISEKEIKGLGRDSRSQRQRENYGKKKSEKEEVLGNETGKIHHVRVSKEVGKAEKYFS
jgi:hypothetical protein